MCDASDCAGHFSLRDNLPPPSVTAQPITASLPLGAGAPYVAINTKKQVYFPEASTRGSFDILNGCVVYRRAGDGRLYTPVFPSGSQLARDGASFYLSINNKKHIVGREVVMGGGEVTLPEYSEISLTRMPPATCPSPIWVVGEIKES